MYRLEISGFIPDFQELLYMPFNLDPAKRMLEWREKRLTHR